MTLTLSPTTSPTLPQPPPLPGLAVLMPRSGSSGGGAGAAAASSGGHDNRGRYAAVVEKGENAWKREWSSFMSGVNLKRLRDGTSGVSLKASADIERQLEARDAAPLASASPPSAAAAEAVSEDGIPVSASFSYLFSSPAERRAERDARDRAEAQRREAAKRELMAKKDPLSVLSKHQRALHDAAQRGLQLEGMTRKARREFLRLTVTEAQKKAEAQARDFKLHDLMDEKLAWYQQGPQPIDLIAEKLVRRKAEKKAKQLGLKYNYLCPHPSWLAKRAQRRRESLLVGLGKRLVFTEEGGAAEAGELMVTDPLHHRTVPLREMRSLLLLATTTREGVSGSAAHDAADAEAEAEAAAAAADTSSSSGGDDVSDDGGAEAVGDDDGVGEVEMGKAAPTTATANATSAAPAPTHVARLPDVGVLQDPSRIATSVVRSVVRDRAAALAIQQLNRTTTFMSAGLVKGPSLQPEDALLENGLPVRSLLTPSPAAAASATPAADVKRGKRSEGAALSQRGSSSRCAATKAAAAAPKTARRTPASAASMASREVRQAKKRKTG